MEQSRDRERKVMRTNPKVVKSVQRHAKTFAAKRRPTIRKRGLKVAGYYPKYRKIYNPWYQYGFRGGFYFPFHPVYAIDQYFWDPTLFWLYSDDSDSDYDQAWYGSDYDDNAFLQSACDFVGDYYPTTELVDVAEAISSMPIDQQGTVRAGLANLVAQLQAQLSSQLGTDVTLGEGDVVITQYQLLDTAIVLDGFVSSDSGQLSFEALLDLNDPSQNLLFVPVGDPTDDQLDALDQINARIADDGGVVDGQAN